MALDLSPFTDAGIDQSTLAALLGEHERCVRPGLERFWSYYRNPARRGRGSLTSGQRLGIGGGQGRSYSVAQEDGLPARLRSTAHDGRAPEVVIENDIGWRIETLVDFLFGKPLRIVSTARDPALRSGIEAALSATWDASGGHALLQDAGLLGSVYGFVDFVVRCEEFAAAPTMAARSAAVRSNDIAAVAAAAARIRIEVVEATRAIPHLDPGDYRELRAYIIRSRRPGAEARHDAMIDRLLRRFRGGAALDTSDLGREGDVLEIISAAHRRVYLDGKIIHDAPGTLGVIPVVHIQNTSQPYRYAGLSDVEPLIPLQDELNTRLSDRAHRVTLQSFNMYLAKGLDASPAPGQASTLRIAPGQVWFTDNPDAEIKAFGGDGQSPSEDRHIEELRDALDKSSGVSPVVIGVIRERLGHLSSENALRITLMGVLNKTARKRLAYGRGIERVCGLILRALDHAGVLHTDPVDRGVRLEWPDPLPMDERARLAAAQLKRDLGVPSQRILEELGYAAPL